MIPLPRGAIIHQPALGLGHDDGRMVWIGDWIEEHRAAFDGKSVLDLGSNCGHFPLEYVKAGARRVVAVEGKSPYVAILERLAKGKPIEIVEQDIRRYIPAGRFDVVSALGILYHVEGFWDSLRTILEAAEPELLLVESEIYEKDGQDMEDGDPLNAGSLGPQMCPRPSVEVAERCIRALGYEPHRVMFDKLYTDIRAFWHCERRTDGKPA